MGDAFVISGLVRKRRELNRAIREHEAEIERLRHGTAIIDQVLLMWSEEGQKRRRGTSDPGPLSRCILTALRLSGEPLGLSDLTRRVMTVRDEAGPLSDYRSRVRRALNRMTASGLLISSMEGKRTLWEIVR